MASDLDEVLRKCDYETLELLIAFAQHQTFAGATRSVTLGERTAKTRLTELNDSLVKLRGTPVLETKNGRRYVLTEAGRELARQASEVNAALRNAVESIEGGRRVEVVTTSNCCEELVRLMGVLDGESDFAIAPILVRTMDVNFSADNSDTEFMFFSTLMERDRARVHQLASIPGGDFIAFKTDPIELVAPKDIAATLKRKPAVSVRSMLNADLTMCVPPGGVAWNYMQLGWPRWEHLRYRQKFHITDLDAGLEVLRTGLAGPRAAMIVHGLGEIQDKQSRLHRLRKRYAQLPVGTIDGEEVVAVTGIVRATRRRRDEVSERIWKAAQDLWVKSPMVVREVG